jgi:uncharacterized protein
MINSLGVAIIKPLNGLCNLCCSYCYMNSLLEPQKSKRSIMSRETLRSTIDFFCSHQDCIEFIWHGGEPLLTGMDFYREAAKIQKQWEKSGKKIANFLQTNAVLINDEWAKFFAEINFFVGVSLDAPSKTHDSLRVTKSGAGSLQKTLEGISFLKKHGVFNGVSCCIGKSNYEKPEEIINFFLEHEIKSIKFLRIKGDSQETISPSQYSDFMIKVFNIWLSLDNPDLEIRDIKSVVDILLGGEFRECTLLGRCDQFATVYSDGSIFPCDNFLNEKNQFFGTVFEPRQKVMGGENFQSILDKIKMAKAKCKDCHWSFLCRGGCLKDWTSSERDDICQANKRFFTVVKETLSSYDMLAKQA